MILRPLDRHKPATEPKRGCRPDRHDTVLASFAVKPNAGTSTQYEIGNLDVDGLRHASACVVECGQESLVALSGPRGRIGSADYGLHFFARQESDQRPAVTLHRNGECALDSGQRLRVLERSKTQEGPDRR